MKSEIMLPFYARNFRPEGTPPAIDLAFVNITNRPIPRGSATGGPNGVLAVQRQLLGENYRGFFLRYAFQNREIKVPSLWQQWVNENKLATMSKNLLFAHNFVQNALSGSLPKKFSTRPGAIHHLVCHDIDSAAAAYLCGCPFTLIYHQQGSFTHERRSFGEELNEAEEYLMNTFERMAFENADRVFFPSHGAKKAFLETTTSVDTSRVNFASEPLYNTVLDFEISNTKTRDFLERHGIEFLLCPEQRKEYILYVSIGDYTSNKGMDRCPEVLTKLARKTDKKIIWICAGSKHSAGIYEDLESRKKEFVYTAILEPKRLPHDLTMGLVKEADWLLMLQRHSIFDFSTLEAMKLGTGVILSPIGGNLEFNKNKNINYVDPDSFDDEDAKHIVECNSDHFGLLNKNAFEDFFSPKQFRSTYLEMYDDIIERTLEPQKTVALKGPTIEYLEENFKGKTVLLCGPGASIKKLGEAEMDGKVLIALNSALRINLPFDIHFMQDQPIEEGFWEEYLARDVERIYGVINRKATKNLAIDFEFLNTKNIDYKSYQLSETAFDQRYMELEFDLAQAPVQDMNGVLFSALQVLAWTKVGKVELVGIDFSEENHDGRNPNKYNQMVFDNLAAIARAYDRVGIQLDALHTHSRTVSEIVGSKGMGGIPVPTKKNSQKTPHTQILKLLRKPAKQIGKRITGALSSLSK